MQISKAGLVEIEISEGWSSGPYWDKIGKVWTAYFGETNGIGPNSPRLTRAQGERKLIKRFNDDYAWALEPFTKLAGFNQNMYDALASFIWNCGTGAVATSTRVGRLLRQRMWGAVPSALRAWSKAGGRTIPGLLARRNREGSLFLRKYASSTTISVLTKWEREQVHILESERRIKERHGGWDKTSDVHLANAVKAKAALVKRVQDLRRQEDQTKANRAEREKYITGVINA